MHRWTGSHFRTPLLYGWHTVDLIKRTLSPIAGPEVLNFRFLLDFILTLYLAFGTERLLNFGKILDGALLARRLSEESK